MTFTFTQLAALIGIPSVSACLITSVIHWLFEMYGTKHKREHASEQILIALAREQLINNFNKAQSKGYITSTEYGEYEKLYAAYKELGGNGTAEALHEIVKHLQILGD